MMTGISSPGRRRAPNTAGISWGRLLDKPRAGYGHTLRRDRQALCRTGACLLHGPTSALCAVTPSFAGGCYALRSGLYSHNAALRLWTSCSSLERHLKPSMTPQTILLIEDHGYTRRTSAGGGPRWPGATVSWASRAHRPPCWRRSGGYSRRVRSSRATQLQADCA